MPEQTIKPVLPVTRSRDLLHQKKPDDANKKPAKGTPRKAEKHKKKGIIDTFA